MKRRQKTDNQKYFGISRDEDRSLPKHCLQSDNVYKQTLPLRNITQEVVSRDDQSFVGCHRCPSTSGKSSQLTKKRTANKRYTEKQTLKDDDNNGRSRFKDHADLLPWKQDDLNDYKENFLYDNNIVTIDHYMEDENLKSMELQNWQREDKRIWRTENKTHKNIHQDALQWLSEPLDTAQIQTDSATTMAYRYDSTSSLHLTDLQSTKDYAGTGLSPTSCRSTSNVRDPRRQPYFGYEPSNTTTSRDELFLIPGQESLMHLPAQSRFSYAYGETALHKYGHDDAQYDYMPQPRVQHKSPQNTPGSRYSYVEPSRSQYSRIESPRGGYSYVEPPRSQYDEDRDRSFDSSNYGSTTYGDDPYSTERHTEGYGREYSHNHDLEYNKGRATELQGVSDWKGETRTDQRRSHRDMDEFRSSRVGTDHRHSHRQSPLPTYGDVTDAKPYGNITDVRTPRSVTSVTDDRANSYRSKYGLHSDAAVLGDVTDCGLLSRDAPHVRSHGRPVDNETYSYSSQSNTADHRQAPSKYDHRLTHDQVNGYQSHFETGGTRKTDGQQMSPSYVAPPAYKKPSGRSHISSDSHINDIPGYKSSTLGSANQEYTYQPTGPTQTDRWRDHTVHPVQTGEGSDIRYSPDSQLNISGSSDGKSYNSATSADRSPQEKTWTYSGAFESGDRDNAMNTTSNRTTAVPQFSTHLPSAAIESHEDLLQKSRLSSYGVKINGDSQQRSYTARSPSPSFTRTQDTQSDFKTRPYDQHSHLTPRSQSPLFSSTQPTKPLSVNKSYSETHTGSVGTHSGEYRSHGYAKTGPVDTHDREYNSSTQTSPKGSHDLERKSHTYAQTSPPRTQDREHKLLSYSGTSQVGSRDEGYRSHTYAQTSPRSSQNGGVKSSPLKSSLRSPSPSNLSSGSPRSSTSENQRNCGSHVKFETDEKENIQDHHQKSYNRSYLHDENERSNSFHGDSPRGLKISDLQPNHEVSSPVRKSTYSTLGRSRHGSSDSLRQSNVPISPSNLSYGRSQSLERVYDGKSSEASRSVGPLTSSMKMTSSREISATALQQFKKRISKSQVQTNVPTYSSTFLLKSGGHGNKPMKTPSTFAVSSRESQNLSASGGRSTPIHHGMKTSSRMASALWAMKLLELLHSNPASNHEELVVKARWFRKWYVNVRVIKRLRMEENQKMEQATNFCRRKLLEKCLSGWRNEVTTKEDAADRLHQKHMLTKGLVGLKYAVSHRMHQSESVALQKRNRMLLQHFDTWKSNFQEQRHHTLRQAFVTWQQLKLDTDRCKELSERTDKRRMTSAFISWRDKHDTTQKDGLAALHYKVNLLSKGLQHWKLYTAGRRVKTTQNEMARVYFGEKTLAKFFTQWKTEHQKQQMAEKHHSAHLLSLTFNGWKRSMSVLRAERHHDISTAKEFHRNALLKIYFVQWNVKLKETLIKKLMARNRLKHFFEVWYLKQQRISIQRQIEESMARKTLKRQTLYTWLVNVRKQKEQREKFVAVLERFHLRQALNDWRQFTNFKKQLREKMHDYQAVRGDRLICKCYLKWRKLFSVRLEQQHARQMWSEQCALKAYDCWKDFVRRRRLEYTLARTQPIRDTNVLRGAFMVWLKAKQQADWDHRRVESVQLILEHNCMHRILAEWRILTKQSKTIQPFVERRHRKLVVRMFDAWRSVILRKHQGHHHYASQQQQKLNGAFTEWKKKAEQLQREKEAAQEILQNKLRRCMQGWHGVAQRSVQCNMFVEQNDHSKLQQSFEKWRQSWEDIVEKRDDDEAKDAQGQILRSVYMKRWQTSLAEEKAKKDECVRAFGEYQDLNSMKSAFFNWRRQYMSSQVAKEYHDDLQTRLMGRVMQSWNEHTKQSFQDSVDKFVVSLGGPSSPTLSLDSSLSQSSASHLSEAMSHSSGFHSNVPQPSTSSSNNGHHGIHIEGGVVLPEEPYRWEGIGIFPKTSSIRARSDSFPSLYSDSLHVEVPQSKQAMMRRVILHWKLWPASTAFRQWLEFTRKQKKLRELRYRTEYTCIILTLKQGFEIWKRHYMAAVMAKRHWETKQKEKCLRAWLYYKIDRKRKLHKKCIADRHADNGMLTRAFIVWRQRTAERRQMIGIVENWQDYVSENVRMEGTARRMRHQIAARTLKECFSVWKMRLQQIEKVKEYYNSVVIRKSLIGWLTVAKQQAERRKKMTDFQEMRCKRMAFYLWQLRLKQKEVVQCRYQDIMENRLREILQRWHYWAIQNHMRSSLCRDLRSVFDIRQLQQSWRVWRQETHRIQKMKVIYQTNLMSKCLLSWHREVQRRKENKIKCAEFREQRMWRTLTTAFHRWCQTHEDTQLANEFRQHRDTVMLRKTFCDWRNFTLEERSSRHFSNNTLQKCFTTWKVHIANQKRLKRKLKRVVEHWRSKTQRTLQLEEIGRRYYVQCQGLQLQSAFKKWRENYEKSQLSQKFYNQELQRRCFRGWTEVITRKIELRKMMMNFREKASIRQMANMFDRWKNEYLLAETRSEMVDLHTFKRDRRILQTVMAEWRQQTRESKADRYIQMNLLRKMWSRWLTAYEYNQKAEVFAQNKQTATMVSVMTFWCQWSKGNKKRRERFETMERTRHRETLHKVFLYWKMETEKKQRADKHYLMKLQQRMICDWAKAVNKKKRLAVTEKLVRMKRERRLLRERFTAWKKECDYRIRIRKLVDGALERRKLKQMHKCFLYWRKETLEEKALRHYRYLVEKLVVNKWKAFTKKRKDEHQHERDMEVLADYHHQKKLSKKILLSWHQEVKMMKFVKSKQKKKLQESWTVWKSSADRLFTAKQIANHKIYNLAWSKWRKVFIQVRVAKAMTSQDNKQLRSEAFNGWRQYTSVHHLGNQVAEIHQHRQLKVTFDLWRERYNSHSACNTMTSYSSAPGNLSSSSSETSSVTWN